MESSSLFCYKDVHVGIRLVYKKKKRRRSQQFAWRRFTGRKVQGLEFGTFFWFGDEWRYPSLAGSLPQKQCQLDASHLLWSSRFSNYDLWAFVSKKNDRTSVKPTYFGITRARNTGAVGTPDYILSGQQCINCRTIEPKTIRKISLDSCAASNLTEKHHFVLQCGALP